MSNPSTATAEIAAAIQPQDLAAAGVGGILFGCLGSLGSEVPELMKHPLFEISLAGFLHRGKRGGVEISKKTQPANKLAPFWDGFPGTMRQGWMPADVPCL